MIELAGAKPHTEKTKQWKHEFNAAVDRKVHALKWPGWHQRGRQMCEAEVAPVGGAFVRRTCGNACDGQKLYGTI
eukprot:9359189-Alexandrium_andersonii.AAC.1